MARAPVAAVLTIAVLLMILAGPVHAEIIPGGRELPGGGILFPRGEYFDPIVADPKQHQSFVSIQNLDIDDLGTYTAGLVGYGIDYGLYRMPQGLGNVNGWQVSIKGGVFSQFNLGAPSLDLINTDFTIGLAVTERWGRLSARTMLYHQSTHLGDEFMLSEDYPLNERVNYSYEAVSSIASFDIGNYLRVYGGGQYLIKRTPESLKRSSAQGGAEFYGRDPILGGRPLAGVDFKGYEQHDWNVDVSVKAGLEFGQPGSGKRRMRVLMEAYEGHIPFSQFYALRMRGLGLGIYLLF